MSYFIDRTIKRAVYIYLLYYYRADFTENRKSIDYIGIFWIFEHVFAVRPTDHKSPPTGPQSRTAKSGTITQSRFIAL